MPSAPNAVSLQTGPGLQSSSYEHRKLQRTVNEHNASISLPIAEDKENDSLLESGKNRSQQTHGEKVSPERKGARKEKECPQTPTPRIPLADLIGNTEDAFNRLPAKAITPEDHVYWKHGPQSSDPSSSMKSKGRKRARSSSPTSSQNDNDGSSHFKKGTFDLDNLQQLLKTPQTDVATDLWNRYADTTLAKATAEGNGLHALAHLMTSSPQTPGTGGSRDNGLRRAISCANEWPTSNAKRRKFDSSGGHNRVRDLFADTKDDILGPGKSKTTKVSLLVEKIQESLSRAPKEIISGPSSSSPMPERGGMVVEPPVSPVPKYAKAQAAPEESHGTETVVVHAVKNENAVDGPAATSDFGDDFGGDDIDFDLLESAELGRDVQDPSDNVKHETVQHAELTDQLPNSADGRTEAVFAEAIGLGLEGVDQSEHPSAHPVIGGGPGDSKDGLDEFDDGAEDLFDVDLESIAVKYDSQEAVPKPTVPSEQAKAASKAQPYQAKTAVVDIDLTNGFSDDTDLLDGDEYDLADLCAAEDEEYRSRNKQAIKRYLIKDIAIGQYENDRGRTQPEKILLVIVEKTGQQKAVTLRQTWFDSPCTNGSYMHLIGEFDHHGQCVVDDANNMIILHPDHLISATVVADSFTCTRRAVLQDRVKATSDASRPQVYGTILHEIFQEALKANNWNPDWLKDTIEKILVTHIASLYEIHVSVPEAVDYLMSKMPELRAWAQIFVASKPAAEGLVQDRNGVSANMSINKLLEVEEHIWSPMYGLKGNVDATVQTVMKDGQDVRTLTVPLEVKTGKNDTNESHRAQTALYTLLLSDRYDVEVMYGILYYLETSKTFRIRGIRNEIRHMIMQRNELACYVHNKLELPPMIKKPHMCNRCYAQTSCFVYHKLIDGGDGASSGVKEKFDEVVQHLKPVHQDFFRKWDDLLTKEEKDMMKFRRELWTMLSPEREHLGRCFSNVVIEPESAYEAQDGPKINRFRYTFVKQKAAPGFSFTESQLTVGEPIVISDEKGHFALANGYITHIRPKRVTVAVDRKLHNVRIKEKGFDHERNQVFRGIMEVSQDGTPLTPAEPDEQLLYRLDKDEFSNGMATVRNNLIRMMEKELFRARELRSLIIEGVPPAFKANSSAYTLSGPASQQNLNVDQKRAIEKVMSAKDYALVLGMPGTGKTTTIAHIIRALVSQGKSVLLASYTHTAVDNILLKIRDDNIRTLRLGAVAKVHPEVQAFVELAGIPKKTIEELEDSYVNCKVVATTCLGVNHPIFNTRVFDYCIVDEASQITLPVCLGPIRMAKTFILVGDHYQLPPLVQNKEAQEGGLDVSLFKLLSDSQPDSVVNLEHQYRMCEDIMLLSNTLIYSGRLKCGTQAVADRTLHIPDLEGGLKRHHHLPSSLASSLSPDRTQRTICAGGPSCWLRTVLHPGAKTRFLNTDPLLPTSLDTARGARIVNTLEALLTTQLVLSLISSGIPARDIGVITFYRSQLSLLRQHLRSAVSQGLEMHTADKFQGRDKEVVILSCVRSNNDGKVGDLLKDWRRVNVALTRARSKLLVIGSKGTLARGTELLKDFIGLMDGRGWCVDLPRGVVDMHRGFDDGGFTQSLTGKVLGGGGDGGSPNGSPTKKKKRSPSPPKKKIPSPPTARTILSPSREQAKSPLRRLSSSSSPRKNNPPFRKPTTVFKRGPEKGGGGVNVRKVLGKRAVLMDVVNDALQDVEWDEDVEF